MERKETKRFGLFSRKKSQKDALPDPALIAQSDLGMVTAVRTVKGKHASELDLQAGEALSVVAMQLCPPGKWVARNSMGAVGFVSCVDVQARADDVRTFMAGVTPALRPEPAELRMVRELQRQSSLHAIACAVCVCHVCAGVSVQRPEQEYVVMRAPPTLVPIVQPAPYEVMVGVNAPGQPWMSEQTRLALAEGRIPDAETEA